MDDFRTDGTREILERLAAERQIISAGIIRGMRNEINECEICRSVINTILDRSGFLQ